MLASSNIAFKEWAVVVDALGSGEQVVILRKGGISETLGEFQIEHRQFWLFPTRFHEAEQSVIPSKRPALQRIAGQASAELVEIEFFVAADLVLQVTDFGQLKRLQGRHIWSEQTLKQRFNFGREEGLHVLVARVYRLTTPQRVPLLEPYGGCKSWIQLEHPIAGDVMPVLPDAEFSAQQTAISELLMDHALTHS
jgi:hypothetical protein